MCSERPPPPPPPRNFPENGLKRLLRNPRNARELLALTGAPEARLLDLERMRVAPTTYIAPDFHDLEQDRVLEAPLRPTAGTGLPDHLIVYVLIEHQSDPDVWMPFRLTDYIVQIFREQRRERSLPPLSPVLPIVFYTGEKRWDTPGRLAGLVALGRRFERYLPGVEPLYLNLSALSPRRLARPGGFLGRALRLLQARRARPGLFRHLLTRTVRHLNALRDDDRDRWHDLLSWLHTLVYHVRDPDEHDGLRDALVASVPDPEREEVITMGRTIADELIEEGWTRGRLEGRIEEARSILLRLLKQRFGDLPENLDATIEATTDLERLATWLDRFATAGRLEDVGIG